MSEVKFNKGSDEWYMFTDFWQLCQKHWKVELTDKYWEDVIFDANVIYDKYKMIPLARRMIDVFLDLKEEEYRKKLEERGEKLT